MAGRFILIGFLATALGLASCSRDESAPAEARRPEPLVIVKPKPKVLTAEQRTELGFPDDLIAGVEAASGAAAEPFFEHVTMQSANLKGDVMLITARLAGFSVRTQKADELIAGLSRRLRQRGYVIFRSAKNFGSVPDIVSVIRGSSSYDILKVQRTESAHYHLDTQAIIAWLRKQQNLGSFVLTGAGADWVEARFVRPPGDMKAFARQVAAFAPDVLRDGPVTVDGLAQRMAETNGFRLAWE